MQVRQNTGRCLSSFQKRTLLQKDQCCSLHVHTGVGPWHRKLLNRVSCPSWHIWMVPLYLFSSISLLYSHRDSDIFKTFLVLQLKFWISWLGRLCPEGECPNRSARLKAASQVWSLPVPRVETRISASLSLYCEIQEHPLAPNERTLSTAEVEPELKTRHTTCCVARLWPLFLCVLHCKQTSSFPDTPPIAWITVSHDDLQQVWALQRRRTRPHAHAQTQRGVCECTTTHWTQSASEPRSQTQTHSWGAESWVTHGA